MKCPVFVYVALLICFAGPLNAKLPEKKDDPRKNQGDLVLNRKDGLVVPFDCVVYIKAVGGKAVGRSEFGTGTTKEKFKPLIGGIPKKPKPGKEVCVGVYAAGGAVPLAIRTNWGGKSYYAFVKGKDRASLVAFSNVNGKGPAVLTRKKGTKNTWILRVDDAASYRVDDSDDDFVVEIRLESPGKFL